MIKVLQVSSDTNIGGAGKCILTFLENYDRSRFDMAVVLPKNSLLKPHIEALGVRIIEADGIADKSLGFEGIKSLKKIFKKEKPDVIHTHASMSARIAARLCRGIKIVYTRHCVYEPSPRISKGIGKKINGFVNNYFTDEIIAVAEAAKKNLTDSGVDERKIKVILNGIKPIEPLTDDEKSAIKKKYGIGENQKVVSILARLEPVKGHEFLLQAAKTVKEKGFDVKFIIAGTGSVENELKQLSDEMGLSDTVLFTGFVSDVREIVNITDISANASYGTEATSIALLEGMCLGKPAVVSDFGGNPGVIENGVNGFLFEAKNASEMAERFCDILGNDELYKSLCEGSVRRFNEKFTADIYTNNIENVYSALCEKE